MMRRTNHIQVCPLTNKIYAGTVLFNGEWSQNKDDVTKESLLAVARHIVASGNPVIITGTDGKPEFEIIVNELK